MFPEHGAPLSSQLIPGLLVIIDDGLDEVAFEFFQRHPSCFRRRFCIMHTVARIGQTPLKALGHPSEEILHGAFRRRSVRRSLLRNDAKSIYQDLTRPLRGEDLSPIMEDDGRLAGT